MQNNLGLELALRSEFLEITQNNLDLSREGALTCYPWKRE